MEDLVLKCLEECLRRDTVYVDNKHLTSDFVKSFGITDEYPGLVAMIERVVPSVIKKLMGKDTEKSYQKIYEICTCLPVQSKLISKAMNEWLEWWFSESIGIMVPRNFGLLEQWFKVSYSEKLRKKVVDKLAYYSTPSNGVMIDFSWQTKYFLENYSLSPETILFLKKSSLFNAVMINNDVPLLEKSTPVFADLSDEEALKIGSDVCDLILRRCSVKEIKRLLYVDLWNKGRLGIKAHLITPSAKEAAVFGVLNKLEYKDLDNAREIATLCGLTKKDFAASNGKYTIREIISYRDNLDHECELTIRVIRETIGLTRSRFNRLVAPTFAERLRKHKSTDTVLGLCRFMQNLGMSKEQTDDIVKKVFLKVLSEGGREMQSFCEYLTPNVYMSIPGLKKATNMGLTVALSYGDSESAIFIKQNFLI